MVIRLPECNDFRYSYYLKRDIMEPLVYFSLSFYEIPLSKADEIRKLLLEMPGFDMLGHYSISYSDAVPMED